MEIKSVVQGFRKVLDELAELQEQKVKEYGTARYEEIDLPTNLLMVYSDVYRKYIRLRGQTLEKILSGERDFDLAGIRETCRDLSNYGGMGVQLIDMSRNLFNREPAPVPKALFELEQIAFVDYNDLRQALRLIGATEWHHDVVTTRARVWGREEIVEQEAHLAFNYQLFPGKELEMIRYISGDNWLSRAQVHYGLSHCGVHVDSITGATERLEAAVGATIDVAQDAVTLAHTNPAIKDTRRYRYRIFNTRRWFGFDLKLIERHIITPGVHYIGWEGYEEEEWLRVAI